MKTADVLATMGLEPIGYLWKPNEILCRFDYDAWYGGYRIHPLLKRMEAKGLIESVPYGKKQIYLKWRLK